MKIRKNDNVMVISGNDKGKTGKVLKVFPKNTRVIVEGINLRKRHTKPSQNKSSGRHNRKRGPYYMLLMLCCLILKQMCQPDLVHR